MRVRPWAFVPLTCLLLLAGCATDRYDQATRAIDKAGRVNQSNALYRQINTLFSDAADRVDSGDLVGARDRYNDVLRVDPRNPRALASLRALDAAQSQTEAIADARQLLAGGDIDGLGAVVRGRAQEHRRGGRPVAQIVAFCIDAQDVSGSSGRQTGGGGRPADGDRSEPRAPRKAHSLDPGACPARRHSWRCRSRG